jgi:hypothetical protein
VPGQRFGFAEKSTITNGIDYLNRLGRNIGIAATSCGRISCLYNAAIYWGNDVGFLVTSFPSL